MIRLRAALRAALVAVALAGSIAGPAAAQLASDVATENKGPDYATWEKIATRAEVQVASEDATDQQLGSTRSQLVDWRSAFQTAQNTNSTRIATLRAQIDALGPAPTDGAAEAPEIAQRRSDLNDQLVRLQAPGISADEAYRRADGIIKEIDRVLRERQTSELLRVLPAPINPANWPDGLEALTGASKNLYDETIAAWANPLSRETLKSNLPLILFYLILAAAALLRGQQVLGYLSGIVLERAKGRWQVALTRILSIGKFVLPLLGIIALQRALSLTSILGPVGAQILEMLPALGFVIVTAVWLGGRLFPQDREEQALLTLPPARRREGRIIVTLFGLMICLEAVKEKAVTELQANDAALAMLTFPIVVLAGLLLVRMGNLMRQHVVNATPANELPSFRDRLIGLGARLVRLLGMIAPVLAAVGYVPAAIALVYPAGLSLALIGYIAVLQAWIDDLYALVTGREDGRDDLIPVLIGFGLVVLSLPLFALIWGARVSDLAELWTNLGNGFTIGETRISPSAFLTFLLIFAIGYMVTKLLQGVLRSSILPRTRLDLGGQNAVNAMVGYAGLALAGLIAINAAGIDLTGLAFVAGALSLGIGFGLQNIVSNFVSGIILLIERPVSEGDWIEVGGVQGTVKGISVRSTRIQTFDRNDVIVPNADLVTGQVTNWTRFNLTGRLIVPIGVAYGSDTRKVERILREIAEAEPLAVMNPPPVVVFMGFGPDAMNFEIRVILRDVNFSLSVRSEMNHEIVRRFTEEGISIPFSQREIWIHNADGLSPLATSQPAGTAAPPRPGSAAPKAKAEREQHFRDEIPDGPGEDDNR
ncbi:DUF3772 domain-containing protein [Tabrizicola sp. J26]|uniref:DUF3772 domain-containing protein n=1 Tax=Alitabrizicola rongguiensis TaxID=2909234 RepID=UPI001F34855C|nr:DUF3772 domain-containing protein [Tabrizicola rongguiensis]MCF1709599.1 DUF3772 domain-containing protein [Tabrizicola rongguiensis]